MAAEKNPTPTTFTFLQREGRSEKLVAEVELVFGEGKSETMKMITRHNRLYLESF